MMRRIFYKIYLASRYLFLNKKLKKIKLVVTDVDGVLTDGGIFLDENGQTFEFKWDLIYQYIEKLSEYKIY